MRDFQRTTLVPAPDSLTLHEQFKLIEIAHETGNSEIRDAALSVLRSGRMMVAMVMPQDA